MPSKDELSNLIFSYIKDFLDEPGNTIDLLSQHTGVSKTIIKRYSQNGLVKPHIITDNAFALLSHFCDLQESAELMKDAYPRWWNNYGQYIISDNLSKIRSTHGQKYSKFHAIMLNEALKEKLTDAWILENYGKKIGFPIRNDLLKIGLIVKKSDRYVTGSLTDINYRSILKRISVECEIFPVELVGDRAFAWEVYELMPKEHRELIQDALRQCVSKVRQIKSTLKGLKKTEDWELFKINLFGSWSGIHDNDIDITKELQGSKNKGSIDKHSLEEKLQLLTENTKMLAHDVRRPLTMIEALINMMQSTDNPSRLNELASQGAEDVKRALSTVNETIKTALAEEESSTLEKDNVSIYEIIFEILKDIFSYRDCQLQIFEFDFKHESLLFIDKEKIKRVMTNILINAVEASPTSQTLWFHTAEDETMIHLTIGNSGSHISRDKLEKIFSSYYTDGKTGGNGIGLSIAKTFVSAHGGRISCHSSEKGVEFLLSLPLAENSQGKETEAVLPKTNLEVSRFSEIKFKTTDTDDDELYFLKVLNRYKTQKLKIIICDDDSLYINGLVNNFKKYPHLTKNLEIEIHTDPQNILNKKADIFILDYDYGEGRELDGLQVAKKLRTKGHKGLICIHSNVLQWIDTRALPDDVDIGYPKPMSQNNCLDILVEGFEKQMDDRDFYFQLEPSGSSIDESDKDKIQIVESCFYGRIVVIDDDPVSCILDLKALDEKGCHILEYKNIDQFIDTIEDGTLPINEIHSIITDMNIGSMDVSKVSFPEIMIQKFKFYKPIFIASYSFVKVIKEPFPGFKYGIPKEELQGILMANL